MNDVKARLVLILRHLRYLCRKELLVTLSDPRMRVMLILPALIQGLLFGYAASYNLDDVPYAVLDQSKSAASRSLLARIDGSPSFDRQATLGNQQDLAPLFESGAVVVAIVIPEDFKDILSSGGTAPVQVITDGRNSSIAGIAAGYVSSIVSAWNAERNGTSSVVVARTWYNPNQITRWNFLPSLIAMISFTQVIMLAGLAIAKEREQGTFDQLLVTPLSPGEILFGKALPPMLIGFIQSGLLFCISYFWFQIPFTGNLGMLAVALFCFMLSSTGIGLSISSVARSMQQVLVYVFVLLMPLVLLSGVATPVSNMPEALQILTYLDPMRYAVDSVRRIYLEGAGLAELWADTLPMLAIACVTLPLSGWLFRHKAI